MLKNILITRPTPFANDLACLLRKHGFNPIVLPFVTTSALPICKTLLEQKYDLSIFTSRVAVYYFAKYQIQLTKAAAVGESTANEVIKNNIATKVIYPKTNYSSEALWGLIEHLEPSTVAIITGTNGNNFLPQRLKTKGWKVTKLNLYARHTITVKIPEVDIILITCLLSLNYLKSISTKYFIIVISDNIKHAAEKLGFTQIIQATSAKNNDILTSLQRVSSLQRT